MRAFKVFRPNYLQQSLSADSYSHWSTLSDIGDFHVQQEAASHSEDKAFRGFDLKLFAKKGKKLHDLLQVILEFIGLIRIVYWSTV